MFKAIAYKEWIKLKWYFWGGLAVGLAVFLTAMIDLRSIHEFNNANDIWGYIIFKKYLFYGSFKYIPLFIGLVFGAAQFYPEMNQLRLKLTLHLPEDENKLLAYMLEYGTLLLSVLYISFMILYSALTLTYFPLELWESMILTMIPWILSGFIVYFFTAALTAEPLWSRRIILGIFTYLFVTYLLIDAGYSAYNKLFIWVIFALLMSSQIFLSGFRFKRGAR